MIIGSLCHYMALILLVTCLLYASYAWLSLSNAVVVTYFSRRRHPFEIILFQHVETGLKLFQNYFS